MDSVSLFKPYTLDNVHPGFSIDCAIFSFHSKKLKVLLNKFSFSRYWQLPGGFMLKTESAENAAQRILASRTGVDNLYLKQFYLFSDPNRTKMDQNTSYIENKKKQTNVDSSDTEKWFLNRFISLGFYAFARYDELEIISTKDDTAKWFDINNLPALYSDHGLIIDKALENIRSIITLIPIAQELLPEKFTMGQFRKVYEIVLEKQFDRRNFQRKALSSEVVIQLDEVKGDSTYNPAILYSFNKEKQDMNDFHSFFK